MYLACSKSLSLISLLPVCNPFDRVDHGLLGAHIWRRHHFFCQAFEAVTFAILANDDHRWSRTESPQFASNVFSQMRRDRATNHDGVKVLLPGQIQYKVCFSRRNHLIAGALDSSIAEAKAGEIVAN